MKRSPENISREGTTDSYCQGIRKRYITSQDSDRLRLLARKLGQYHVNRETSHAMGRTTMKFKDLFVPKYLHSDPEVRLKFVGSTEDTKLLKSMAEQDSDVTVRKAAAERVRFIEEDRREAA